MRNYTLNIILVIIIAVLAVLFRWEGKVNDDIQYQYEKLLEAARMEARECKLNEGNPNLLHNTNGTK